MPTMQIETMSRTMCEVRAAMLHEYSRKSADPREREMLQDLAHAHGLYAHQQRRPLLSTDEIGAMEKLPAH